MTPIFFPFTYVTEPVARALGTCFGRSRVFLPSGLQIPPSMRQLAEKGWLSLETPFAGDDTALKMTIKGYREWTDLHGTGQLRQLVEQLPPTPFYGDASVYRLLEELKKNDPDSDGGQNLSERRSEFILKSRLFLQMAQEFDRRNQAMRKDLAAVDILEDDLRRHLHANEYGDDDRPPAHPLSEGWDPQGDDVSYMLFERLTAWTCFLFPKADRERFLVTTSRLVVERLIEALPESAPVWTLEGIPVREPEDDDVANWKKELGQWLADGSAGNETDDLKVPPQPPSARSGEPSLALTVYRVRQSPLSWFGQVAGIGNLVAAAGEGGQPAKATLLAYVKRA